MLAFIKKMLSPHTSELSFSQCGEDRIVKFVFDVLRIQHTKYLDIGSHHPRRWNNTYLSYLSGGSGVLVEPNPHWCSLIRKERPRDVCLAAGLAGEALSAVPFYIMKSDALCTFSRREAERMVAECDEEIREVKEIEVLTPDAILSTHFKGGLNYVSLDVEGWEMEILEAFDLKRNRPEVFCVETLSYAVDGSGKKSLGVIEFMKQQEYMVFADTHINTIFVDRSCWENLGRS